MSVWVLYVQANYGGVKGKIESPAIVEQSQPEEDKGVEPDSDEEGEPREEGEELNKSDEEDEVCECPSVYLKLFQF